MTFYPNSMGNSAFESPWCILSKNKKIFDPSSIHFDFCYHWGRMKIFEAKNLIFMDFGPSSKVAEIKGNWGRMKNFLFSENMHQGLSNALFLDFWNLLVIANDKFKVFQKNHFFKNWAFWWNFSCKNVIFPKNVIFCKSSNNFLKWAIVV